MTDQKRDIPPEFMLRKPFEANTGRRWSIYQLVLKLEDIKDWQNKVILDIGAGYKPSYDQKVAKLFPGARVIAIDPAYIINGKGAHPIGKYDQYHLRNMSSDYDPDIERRIGVVQALPVDDHSVDQIWSVVAVPTHLPINHQGRMWAEMLRTLKPKGQIRVAPFAAKQDSFYASLLKQYDYEVEQYQLDHNNKNLPRRGVILRVPDVSVTEAHTMYEAFKTYLLGANLYASGNNWSTRYFYADEPLVKIENPKKIE